MLYFYLLYFQVVISFIECCNFPQFVEPLYFLSLIQFEPYKVLSIPRNGRTTKREYSSKSIISLLVLRSQFPLNYVGVWFIDYGYIGSVKRFFVTLRHMHIIHPLIYKLGFNLCVLCIEINSNAFHPSLK